MQITEIEVKITLPRCNRIWEICRFSLTRRESMRTCGVLPAFSSDIRDRRSCHPFAYDVHRSSSLDPDRRGAARRYFASIRFTEAKELQIILTPRRYLQVPLNSGAWGRGDH